MLTFSRISPTSIFAAALALTLVTASSCNKDEEDAEPTATDPGTVQSSDQPGDDDGGGSGEGGGDVVDDGSDGDGGDDGPGCVAPEAILHVAIRDTTNNRLRHGTNECGSWVYETIDDSSVAPSGNTGRNPAIAVDSAGRPAIAHYAAGVGILVSYRNEDKTWSTTVADNLVPPSMAIAFDDGDNIHLAYGSQSSGHLYYNTNASGSWQPADVDSSSDVGRYVSIAIDSANDAHIAHYQVLNNTQGNLKYTKVSTGSTMTTMVDSATWGAGYNGTSILIGTNGKPYIAFHQYRDNSNNMLHDLYVSTNTTGSWLKTMAHPNSSSYSGATLMMDGSGTMHIAHLSLGNNIDIVDYNGSAWVSAASSPGAISGNGPEYVHGAVDADGHLHTMYARYVSSAGAFKINYATNASGSWVSGDLDLGVNTDAYTSFAVAGAKANNNRP